MVSEQSVCVLDAAMYTPAYLHTFIGCDKTPVFTQALKIQKLNERNDVQIVYPCLLSLVSLVVNMDGTVTPLTCSQQGEIHQSDKGSRKCVMVSLGML